MIDARRRVQTSAPTGFHTFGSAGDVRIDSASIRLRREWVASGSAFDRVDNHHPTDLASNLVPFDLASVVLGLATKNNMLEDCGRVGGHPVKRHLAEAAFCRGLFGLGYVPTELACNT